METVIGGREITFNYSETWLGYSILGLRLVMAYVLLSAGLEKLAEGGWTNFGGWSAEGYLDPDSGFGVGPDNPFAGVFAELAAQSAIVDPMVMWTQILIGLALLFGVLFRLAVLGAALQMLLFWIAAFEGGIMAGLPVQHGYLIDSSFVYALVLFGLGAWGAGRILGVDAYLEELDVVQDNPWLKYLLG